MGELVAPAPEVDRTPSCLAEARLGHHLAHLFRGAPERAAAAAELLAAGMSRGERALGLGDEASLELLAAAVAARGVDVPTALARGALQLVPHREQFLPDGRFDPDQVLRAWQVRTEAAVAAGFTGLVVAIDMDWALSGAPGTERLLEYEAAQGLAFGRHFAGMCQYDLARFEAPLVHGVLRAHALVVHGGQVLRNPGAAAVVAPSLQPAQAEAAVEALLRALHARPEAGPAQAPGRAAAAARGRVLVVDDEPLVGKAVARLLSEAHDVTVLTSAREALRRAEAGERWDLVLCDLMMPDLDGPGLAGRLAQAAPDLAARMVFLTGGAFTAQAQAFLASGRPWLEKPIDPVELRACARQAVAAARAAGGAG